MSHHWRSHRGYLPPINQFSQMQADVIINEFSQGSGTAKEWVELLVVTDNLNLQDHQLIDGNGSLAIKLTGVGFASLKAGTLLVLYNGSDIDEVLVPDLAYNPAAGDYSLQVSSQNATGDFAITRTKGWDSTNGAFANASVSDLPQLLNLSGTLIHSLPRPTSAGSRFTAYQSNRISGANSAATWSPDGLSTLATPGLGNGGSNTVWIDNLRGNVAPVLDTTGNPTLPSINQGVTNPNGVQVTDLIASLGGTGITDIDRGSFNGIAVTRVNNANGNWEYSINGGNTWTAFGSNIADNSATVLLGSASLYNSTLGNAPDQQGWLSYTNLKIESGIPTPGTSTQSATTSGTVLNTTADSKNYAGYSNYDVAQQQVNPTFPALDRASGYSLSFSLQLLSESRTNENRAGFSVIALSSDQRGIELGFQQTTATTGKIFAQSDDITPTLESAEWIVLAAESVSLTPIRRSTTP
ncbi:MAG: hypothetical protein HC936_15720 [Leptolyngbyaceae cyanobacterium SU_3_3]|nr:hypothetical protein [Leptolyngbyaceae cyanobacterium SU_3_3]